MDWKNVLEFIKESRCGKGYSQEYIATKMGVAQASYSRLEQGKQEMSLKQFLNVMEILGHDTKRLIANIEENKGGISAM